MSDHRSWVEITRDDPSHSSWDVERFRSMRADGVDLDGEARLVDAMVGRAARILDAGCGPGRVGAALATRGHTVIGVDVDPVLIAAAEADHPGPTWLVGDLAELDLPSRGISERFDVIVSAGNVVPFIAAASRIPALKRLGAHLADDGRLVVGFGAGRGYSFEQFFADAEAAGLAPQVLLSTWDLRPFVDTSDFLVAVLGAA